MDVPGPIKYIRTFARDMAVVQKGGTPNLAPLEKKADTGPAGPAPAAPAPAPQAPDKAPPPSPPLEASSESVQKESPDLPTGKILPSMPAGHLSVPMAGAESPVLEDLPKAPPPPPPPPPPLPPLPPLQPAPLFSQAPTRTSPIKTYSNDFSNRMKTMNASTATILAAEQDARKAPIQIQKERGGLAFVLGGIILLFIGAGAAYFAYVQFAPDEPVILTVTETAPIFTEQSDEIAGTGSELARELNKSLAQSLPKGSVRHLYRPLISGSETSFFAALELPAPDMLIRNINTKGSMAGIMNANSASAFFILSVTSYSDTFAAMLAWEMEMPRDLVPLLGAAAVPIIPPTATTTATTTESSATISSSTAKITRGSLIFTDEVISNHDTRVYRDESGQERIVYGYWNPTTLVIARDKPAFSELMTRLANSRQK